MKFSKIQKSGPISGKNRKGFFNTCLRTFSKQEGNELYKCLPITALVWKMQVLHVVFSRYYSRVIAVSTWPLLLYMALEAELFPGSLRTRGLKLSSLMMVREQKGAEVFQGTATELQPGSEKGEQSKVSFIPVLGSKQQPGSFEQRVYEAAVVSEVVLGTYRWGAPEQQLEDFKEDTEASLKGQVSAGNVFQHSWGPSPQKIQHWDYSAATPFLHYHVLSIPLPPLTHQSISKRPFHPCCGWSSTKHSLGTQQQDPLPGYQPLAAATPHTAFDIPAQHAHSIT